MPFELSYASVPFCLEDRDVMQELRASQEQPENLGPFLKSFTGGKVASKLLNFIGNLLPFRHRDYQPKVSQFPGPNLFKLANDFSPAVPDLEIGEYFYPTGACRWSQFTGIATTAQKDAMVAIALGGGSTAQTFIMEGSVSGPQALAQKTYRIETQLFMLPPRPISENGTPAAYWLVTLVDERFYWQWSNAQNFQVDDESTWGLLLLTIADVLDIDITDDGATLTVDSIADYLVPEADSQLWSQYENAGRLFDAIAENIGRDIVRNFDGTYDVQSPAQSLIQVGVNRGTVIRQAGGDILSVSGAMNQAANAILPHSVLVSFPKYVIGDVPHFLNERYTQTTRPSAWTEDSYGSVYTKEITLQDAGASYSQYQGFPGVKTFHDTAKAWLETEEQLEPVNQTELDDLALVIAQNYWDRQRIAALDETYPGTLKWTPEGTHDIIWTFRNVNGMGERQLTTRVFRQPWNQGVQEFQHSSGPVPGVGGHTIPLTVRDNSLLITNDAGEQVTPTWYGEFSMSVDYVFGNVVLYEGVLYNCILDSSGNLPTNTTYWEEYTDLTWQGAWDATTDYVVKDAVQTSDGYFAALKDSTNQEPPDSTYWQTLEDGQGIAATTVYGVNTLTFAGGTVELGESTNGLQEAIVTFSSSSNVVARIQDSTFPDYTPPSTTLTAQILAAASSCTVADGGEFPATGSFWIKVNGTFIYCSGRTSNTFTFARAYNSYGPVQANGSTVTLGTSARRWIEQEQDPYGNWVDKTGGRNSQDDGPAVFADPRTAAAISGDEDAPYITLLFSVELTDGSPAWMSMSDMVCTTSTEASLINPGLVTSSNQQWSGIKYMDALRLFFGVSGWDSSTGTIVGDSGTGTITVHAALKARGDIAASPGTGANVFIDCGLSDGAASAYRVNGQTGIYKNPAPWGGEYAGGILVGPGGSNVNINTGTGSLTVGGASTLSSTVQSVGLLTATGGITTPANIKITGTGRLGYKSGVMTP